MNFELTEEQRMIAATARQVGERFGLDYWRKIDAEKKFPTEIWQAICDAGLGGVALPPEYGGSGLGMLEMALIVENLAAAGAGSTIGQMFMVNPIFGGVSISKFGTPEMKRDLLPKLISGEMGCCMALTEPDAGTNTLEIRSFARAQGDSWILNGRKIWITAVDAADKMLVIARTKKLEESRSRSDGLTMFMIDVERKGLTYTPIDKVAGVNCWMSSIPSASSRRPGWSEQANWRSNWPSITPTTAKSTAINQFQAIRAYSSRWPSATLKMRQPAC